jgi:hypothetical protein
MNSYHAVLVALAIRSGIPPSVWLKEPPEYLETALTLLENEANNG